jgi:putative hydrolase of the HAD superfamily
MRLKALGFDIDGTLYPNRAVYLRLAPFTIAHPRFMRALSKTRKELRRSATAEGFYEAQARILGKHMGIDAEKARAKIDKWVYDGWERHFKRVKLFPGLVECLDYCAGRGLKLGALSDFPVRRKLESLGLWRRFDFAISSEETGRLKPDGAPFAALARGLGCEPGELLYVGNSIRYDIEGAKAAGMMTAWIGRGRKPKGADFAFRAYGELTRYVASILDSEGRA